MGIAAQVNIYFFPLMVLAIMWYDSLVSGPRDRSARLFRASLAFSFAAMALEATMWFMNGEGGFPCELVLGLNTAYLLVAGASTLLWPAYLHVQLRGNRSLLSSRRLAFAVIAPYVVMAALVLSNIVTGLIFTVDAVEGYRRGPLFFLPYALMMAYLAAGFTSALVARSRQASASARNRALFLALVGLLPIVGAVVQMSFYGWWLMWPSVVVMLLLVYLTIQNRRLESDPLTGLGNRRAFDRRLQAQLHRPGDSGWCLMVIDVDGLKIINDTRGHAAGDEALCRMADALRATFGASDSFIARFGGDEFAVIAPCAGNEGAEALVARLGREALAVGSGLDGVALEFSAGFVLGHADDDPAALVKRADEAMYRCKEARRHASASGRVFAGTAGRDGA
ncbi:GGDEF domain-containing protein [Arabiibacter massiliensis]|uniref:GGDEF domain-containing protein n=1 Tax=Arabiibacter massiliensis TaxID=1870985 RepID=UPI0009B95C3F|nr:GGDEF domain-containing protein [Arabiibacter massiliensis]